MDSFRAYERSFTNLADAQAFFTDDLIDIGFQRGGFADVELVFSLTASDLPSGFQFNYAFGTTAAVPGAHIRRIVVWENPVFPQPSSGSTSAHEHTVGTAAATEFGAG